MKVFAFDPETGKRGEELEQKARCNWTGPSVQNQVASGKIEPVAYTDPSFGKTSHVTVHTDAGRETGPNRDSYRLPDQWVCFCLGSFSQGAKEWWEWVVLPAGSAIIEKTK